MKAINDDLAAPSLPCRVDREAGFVRLHPISLPVSSFHLVTSLLGDHHAHPDGRRECLKQSKIVINIDGELQAIFVFVGNKLSFHAISYQLWTPNHARHTTTYLTAIVVTQ